MKAYDDEGDHRILIMELLETTLDDDEENADLQKCDSSDAISSNDAQEKYRTLRSETEKYNAVKRC